MRAYLQPDETHLAAGMSDGTLSIRRRQPKSADTSDPLFSAAALKSGTYESFLGGTLPAIGQGKFRTKPKLNSKAIGDANEMRVKSTGTKRLREYDRLLKGFKYSAALDSALRKVCIYSPPSVIFCS
jgi:U3 small nucleolar RNA-associated protein 15